MIKMREIGQEPVEGGYYFTYGSVEGLLTLQADLLKHKIIQKSDSRVCRVNARGNSLMIEHRDKYYYGHYQDSA